MLFGSSSSIWNCLFEKARAMAPPTSSTSRHVVYRPSASQAHSLHPTPLYTCRTAWLKFPLVCAASPCLSEALLILQTVLDGGTGFLKVGYAGQVGQHMHSLLIFVLTRRAIELPRAPVPLNSRPPYPANRRAKWRRHTTQGHHVRRRRGNGALHAPDHVPCMCRFWTTVTHACTNALLRSIDGERYREAMG